MSGLKGIKLMPVDMTTLQKGRAQQSLHNSSIHNWYRFVLSFPDHLVDKMLVRFGAGETDTVLDPFCGTGTTLVECKKRGINAIGIEANPACVFASQVKTSWEVSTKDLRAVTEMVLKEASPACDELALSGQPLFAAMSNAEKLKQHLLDNSPEGQYFISSGMLKRGWVSEIPFYKTLALLQAIKTVDASTEVQDVLKLALVATLVADTSNVSFGPEIYVSHRRDDADVIGTFRRKMQGIAEDLENAHKIHHAGQTQVLTGDARECAKVLQQHNIHTVDFVITSPPYPTEKDYTRQTRLEMVFLGYVYNRKSLQRIKKSMVRSNSKGVYKADTDGQEVADVAEVQAIANELRAKVANKTYGFAKLYPRIIEEYFGGMNRHLVSLWKTLHSGGEGAYVVGEQRTYLQTYTPTGKILAILAERVGFEVEDLLVWRVRKGTTGSGEKIKEEILILRKP